MTELRKLFNTPVSDFELEIQLGNIPNHEWVSKDGRIDNVDTADPPVDVWNGAGIYSGHPLGAAETMEIFSSSVNDTAAGTGARTITISRLLDEDYNQMPDVTLTLNGTTPVSLGAQTYLRTSEMVIQTVGSSGHNEGDLTLRHTVTTANIFAVMPALKNSTVILCDTVPAGKTLYVKRGFIKMSRASGAAGSANVTIRFRLFGTDKPFIAGRDVEITQADSYLFENSGYFVFPEKTDFKVSVEAVSDNNTIVTAEYAGFFRDNT